MVDIEHSIEAQELMKFNELAAQMGKELAEVIELCMFEKRDEYLDMFANNIPEEEKEQKKSEHRDITAEPSEGTEEEAILDTTSQDGFLSESGDTTP